MVFHVHIHKDAVLGGIFDDFPQVVIAKVDIDIQSYLGGLHRNMCIQLVFDNCIDNP